jgi:hypothetical protein
MDVLGVIALKELILSEKKSLKASADNLAEYLGVPKYRYGEIEAEDLIGMVTGLAWTDVGGELLTIEATMMPGKGKMTVTGNLRDVMKESISAAAAYVRSRAVAVDIEDAQSIPMQPQGDGWFEAEVPCDAGDAGPKPRSSPRRPSQAGIRKPSQKRKSRSALKWL